MSEKSQLILMAEYNKVMNTRMIESAGNLSNTALSENRGAFFKSVIGTLNHIMIGDVLWLKRFAQYSNSYASLAPVNKIEKPERLDSIMYDDLDSFAERRLFLDDVIIRWCGEVMQKDLDSPLKYINYKGETHNKRLGDLLLHLFLHQVHHRGQITTLLSQEGIDFGETDLPEFITDKELA